MNGSSSTRKRKGKLKQQVVNSSKEGVEVAENNDHPHTEIMKHINRQREKEREKGN